MDPTAASIATAGQFLDADFARIETELLRLLRVNVPLTITARGDGVEPPAGYELAPADLSEQNIKQILVALSERKTTMGVMGFKTIAAVEFSCIAGKLPVSESLHRNARRLAGIVVSIFGGYDVSGNHVMLGWKDPDGYVLWAELTPSDDGISPIVDDNYYGYTVSYQMLLYPGSNGTTT